MPLKFDELPNPRTGWLMTGGVVLPALAILLELYSGAMAEAYLDPMPTVLHLLLLLAVPMGVLYLLRCVRLAGEATVSKYVVAGVVLTISGLYAITYLPFYSAAILAIPIFGVGLLALSPCTAFLASLLILGRMEGAPSRRIRWRALLGGALIAVLLLGGASGRLVLLEYGVRLVAHGDSAERGAAIAWLHRTGSERELLARSLRIGPAQKGWHALWEDERLSRIAYGKAYAALTGSVAESADAPWTLWQRPATAVSRAPESLWDSR